METANRNQGLILSSVPESSTTYEWVCLFGRCPHRSTFAVDDPTLCFTNAHNHARRTDHKVRVTSKMVTTSDHWMATTWDAAQGGEGVGDGS